MQLIEKICLQVAFLGVSCYVLHSSYAESIYSQQFNYKNFGSSSVYFSGKSGEKITIFCKTLKHASQEDMDQCAHREFETASHALDEEFEAFSAKARKNDIELHANSEPLAAPYFEKSQEDWAQYRDNYCYGATYQLGEASVRYLIFWNCMTRITKNRLAELKNPDE